MNPKLLLGFVFAAIAVTGLVMWLALRASQPPAAAEPAPQAAAADTALQSIVQQATTAAATADTDAKAAAPVAAEAARIAGSAANAAMAARAAAEEAGKAAARACKSPTDKLGCNTAADGTEYAGEQSCRADGCGPDGFGVFKDARKGWASAGEWYEWSLILGCDTLKGATVYCGFQADSAWSGLGVSTNAEAATISANWLKGVGQNPIQLDYPSGSRMRGEMADYVLNGLGVYERNDRVVLSGRWSAGKIASGTVVYPATGTRLSASFSDGIARSGVIAWTDGRRFVGLIEDLPTLAEARPLEGVLYAPDGAIEVQGRWTNGLPPGR